jgi:hypothetical protein
LERIFAAACAAGDGFVGDLDGVVDAAAFGDDQWHHIALRRSANTLSLIVDGIIVDSDTTSRQAR